MHKLKNRVAQNWDRDQIILLGFGGFWGVKRFGSFVFGDFEQKNFLIFLKFFSRFLSGPGPEPGIPGFFLYFGPRFEA